MPTSDRATNNRAQEAVEAGRDALEASRYEEAADLFRSALRTGAWSAEEEALIRCQLAQALEKRGLYREALDAVARYNNFQQFTRLSERAQMTTLIQLGWSHSYNNDIPRAIALFNQALEIANRVEDDAGIGTCYFGLARSYRNFNEIRIASDHYASALEYYRRAGDWRKIAESYVSLGYLTSFEGDYRGGLHALKQALTIIGDRDEHDLKGRAHMYMAVTYDRMGILNKALDSWEKCIEHFRRANNTVLLAVNYNNLADRLITLCQWERAEEMLNSAVEMLRGTTSVANLGGTLDTLAHLYLLRGQVDEASQLLEESLQVLSSHKVGEWAEGSTLTTIGRTYLAKKEFEAAIKSIEQSVEICKKASDYHHGTEAQLWLAESHIQKGNVEQARAIVEGVRSLLDQAAQIKLWGMLMRTVAKIEDAEGHAASAIQSLGQSTSAYEICGNTYAVAVNRVIYARIIERQGCIRDAIPEVESALSVFEQLGARLDEQDARSYLELLNTRLVLSEAAIAKQGAVGIPAPDLASAIDGFISQRLVQASISRELLLHELVSIVRERASGRAALVAEVEGGSLKVAASVGLSEREKTERIEFLSRLPAADFNPNFVYPFSDNYKASFLLHIVGAKAERLASGEVNLRPLLLLAQLALETESHRSRSRRAQVFDPARLLAKVQLPGFICASRAMTRVLDQIHKIRSSDVMVLITGESGTGKELIARAVHADSSRRFNLFLPFNCSAAPREMIESQLFGYRKGAFTGALASNEGIIRAAQRGTLFLDEIGDLPLDLQPKLLRFLQEGEIHPIGENQPLRVDVRVVAATNADLERAVAEGKFREDLFHRLNVIRIEVPPLRQRREEIPALLNHFLSLYQQESSKRDIRLSEEAVDLMVVYDWPGNVRQLSNEVRRIVAYNESGTIVTQEMLSAEIVRASREGGPAADAAKIEADAPAPQTAGKTIAEVVSEIERQMIEDALRRSAGNIARTAKELGLTRRGLYMKMDRLRFKA